MFPTLAVGLLDFKVDVVLARLEASLQCRTAKYPCSAQPQSILTLPKRKVSLQCPTAEYPCSHQISLQGPTEKYPCSAQAQTIPGVPNSKASIFLQRIFSAARKTVEGGRKTLHFLCNNGFRVGMLEVNNFCMIGLNSRISGVEHVEHVEHGP